MKIHQVHMEKSKRNSLLLDPVHPCKPCFLSLRDMCQRMVEKIQRKDGEGAITMLERDPSMAWMRDSHTGAYPLHIAVWQVLFPPFGNRLLAQL